MVATATATYFSEAEGVLHSYLFLMDGLNALRTPCRSYRHINGKRTEGPADMSAEIQK
jgi:hypothetical protein